MNWDDYGLKFVQKRGKNGKRTVMWKRTRAARLCNYTKEAAKLRFTDWRTGSQDCDTPADALPMDTLLVKLFRERLPGDRRVKDYEDIRTICAAKTRDWLEAQHREPDALWPWLAFKTGIKMLQTTSTSDRVQDMLQTTSLSDKVLDGIWDWAFSWLSVPANAEALRAHSTSLFNLADKLCNQWSDDNWFARQQEQHVYAALMTWDDFCLKRFAMFNIVQLQSQLQQRQCESPADSLPLLLPVQYCHLQPTTETFPGACAQAVSLPQQLAAGQASTGPPASVDSLLAPLQLAGSSQDYMLPETAVTGQIDTIATPDWSPLTSQQVIHSMPAPAVHHFGHGPAHSSQFSHQEGLSWGQQQQQQHTYMELLAAEDATALDVPDQQFDVSFSEYQPNSVGQNEQPRRMSDSGVEQCYATEDSYLNIPNQDADLHSSKRKRATQSGTVFWRPRAADTQPFARGQVALLRSNHLSSTTTNPAYEVQPDDHFVVVCDGVEAQNCGFQPSPEQESMGHWFMCKGQAAVKVCGRIASGRLIIASQSEPSIGAQEDDSDPASMQRAVAIALEAKPTDDSSEVRASVIFGLGRMSSLVASGQLSQEAARQYLDDTHKELEHFANPAKDQVNESLDTVMQRLTNLKVSHPCSEDFQGLPICTISQQKEMESCSKMLTKEGCRVLSLVGPAGCGTTTAAKALGRYLMDTHQVQAFFVSLQGARSVSDALLRIALQLEIVLYRRSLQSCSNSESLQRICDILKLEHHQVRKFVLVLDDIQAQLLQSEDYNEALHQILGSHPHVQIVTTSQDPSGGAGLLHNSHVTHTVGLLSATDSESLLRCFAPSLTDQDCQNLAEVCSSMPLAVCAVGYALRQKSHDRQVVTEIVARILAAPSEAGSTAKTVVAHQRLLHVIACSLRCIPEHDLLCLACLSLFPYDFDLAAAAAVLGEDVATTRQQLQSLCGNQWLQSHRWESWDPHMEPGSNLRFQLHSLLGQGAQDLCRHKFEFDQAEQRFMLYHLSLLSETFSSHAADEERLRTQHQGVQGVLARLAEPIEPSAKVLQHCIVSIKSAAVWTYLLLDAPLLVAAWRQVLIWAQTAADPGLAGRARLQLGQAVLRLPEEKLVNVVPLDDVLDSEPNSPMFSAVGQGKAQATACRTSLCNRVDLGGPGCTWVNPVNLRDQPIHPAIACVVHAASQSVQQHYEALRQTRGLKNLQTLMCSTALAHCLPQSKRAAILKVHCLEAVSQTVLGSLHPTSLRLELLMSLSRCSEQELKVWKSPFEDLVSKYAKCYGETDFRSIDVMIHFRFAVFCSELDELPQQCLQIRCGVSDMLGSALHNPNYSFAVGTFIEGLEDDSLWAWCVRSTQFYSLASDKGDWNGVLLSVKCLSAACHELKKVIDSSGAVA